MWEKYFVQFARNTVTLFPAPAAVIPYSRELAGQLLHRQAESS